LAQNLNPTLSKLFVSEKLTQFENKTEFLFTLKRSETRELAGVIYIKELDWPLKQGELAYCIGYTFEGQGLTTKAISALVNFAFNDLGIETLQIIAHKDNLQSAKVALNNDFKWQRTLENEFTPSSEQPLDMELYELYKN
ncbi:MAG: GNAT family N-acetyltransferase, partial [Winogradskyella sp.]|nr:GNAT family N-acetyltransferase [Winogradskyella sp.]